LVGGPQPRKVGPKKMKGSQKTGTILLKIPEKKKFKKKAATPISAGKKKGNDLEAGKGDRSGQVVKDRRGGDGSRTKWAGENRNKRDEPVEVDIIFRERAQSGSSCVSPEKGKRG